MNGRNTQRTNAALAGAALLAVTLTSCALIEGPTPNTPERSTAVTPAPTPEQTFELVLDGSAEDNLPYFQQTLAQFATSDAPIEGRPVVDALAAAGFDKANMQVTFDHSRTNLVADNLFVSVRFEASCLVGQFVTDTRELFTAVEGALGHEQNICIIGTTRPIDW